MCRKQGFPFIPGEGYYSLFVSHCNHLTTHLTQSVSILTIYTSNEVSSTMCFVDFCKANYKISHSYQVTICMN